MRFVVASAVRTALGRLILVFGLLAVIFTGMARTEEFVVYVRHSPWDLPIVIGIAAASVLVAALIYPKRRASLTAHAVE
jgi:hypothetical protein